MFGCFFLEPFNALLISAHLPRFSWLGVHFSGLMRWCAWGSLQELTSSPFLLYVHFKFQNVACLMFLTVICLFSFLILLFHVYRWSIGSGLLVWCLFPLYAEHHLGQNGCITRFVFCYHVILFVSITQDIALALINEDVMQFLSNLLYFYGMCDLMKDCLIQRYFSKVFFCVILILCDFPWNSVNWFYYFTLYLQEARGNDLIPESDIVQTCRSVSYFIIILSLLLVHVLFPWRLRWVAVKIQLMVLFLLFFFNLQLLDERQSANVLRFLEAINGYAFVL